MTWLAVRNAVQAAIVAASGLDTTAVIWGTQTDVCADPVIRLEVLTSVEDQPVRDTLTNGATDLTYKQEAVHLTTIQVLCESVSDLQIVDAMSTAQRTRMAIQSLLTRPGLPFVLVSVAALRTHHYRVDGRLIQAWSFDLQIRHLLTLTYVTPVGTIETVGVSGDTTDPTITVPEEFFP